MEIILGIDLGTFHSVISFWNKKESIIISDNDNDTVFPSVIKLNDNIYYDIKKLIGRTFDDPFVQEMMHYVSYDISEVDNKIIIDEKYSPEELIGHYLRSLNLIANNFIQTKYPDFIYNNKVVITIPSYFNESQRQATLDSSLIAGLDCLKIINEPTAASLAYGIDNLEEDRYIIVYDFGAGTLDVSCINICDKVFNVIATAGNNNLGGENFTFKLMDYVLDKINKFDDLYLLREECEKCKIALSTELEYTITLKEESILITREIFETICSDLFDQTLEPIYNIIEFTKIDIEQIKEIILVGGSTLIPYLQFQIKSNFEVQISNYLNPFHVVSIGASIQGYMLEYKEDPFFKDVLLLDVIALSLGIETANGLFNKIIERNSMIPIEKKKKFKTSEDNMSEIVLDIYQGEKSIAKENYHIGQLILNNIKNVSNNRTLIDVIFRIDQNSIIHVLVSEYQNENKVETEIDLKTKRLSKSEINNIIENYEKEAKEDQIKSSIISNYYFYYISLQKIKYNSLFLKLDVTKDLALLSISDIFKENEFYEFEFNKSQLKIIVDNSNLTLISLIDKQLQEICNKIREKFAHLITEMKIETIEEKQSFDYIEDF